VSKENRKDRGGKAGTVFLTNDVKEFASGLRFNGSWEGEVWEEGCSLLLEGGNLDKKKKSSE